MNLDILEQAVGCPSCRTEMKSVRGTLRFEDDGIGIEVSNVPMLRCESCGEEFVPGPISEVISKFVNDLADEARNAPIENTELKTNYQGHVPDLVGAPVYAD